MGAEHVAGPDPWGWPVSRSDGSSVLNKHSVFLLRIIFPGVMAADVLFCSLTCLPPRKNSISLIRPFQAHCRAANDQAVTAVF